MKIINLIVISLLILFTLPTKGQQDTIPAQMEQDSSRKQGMGQRESDTGKGDPGFTDVLAKPSFVTSSEKYHLKVWVMSKMKGMDDTEVSTGVSNEFETAESTHHIMVEVADPLSGKEITDAEVKIQSVSPTDKSTSVKLEKMMDQYGGNLVLDEKGEYEISVNVNVNGESKLIPFKYKVK